MLEAALFNLQVVFAKDILLKAKKIYETHQVLMVRLSDGLIKARVKDHTNHVYDVFLNLKKWPTEASRCGCTKLKFCEHAAASLLALGSDNSGSLSHLLSKIESFSQQPISSEKIISEEDIVWFSNLEKIAHNLFDYSLGIEIDGQKISMLPLMTALLNSPHMRTWESFSDEKIIQLTLGKGKLLQLPLGRIRWLLNVFVQLNVEKSIESVTLNNAQLLWIQEAELALQSSRARWMATEHIQSQLSKLSQLETLPDIKFDYSLPLLRPYQTQGVKWLQCLREYGFSGILADDMGLGKTVQTLAHLQIEKQKKRIKAASLIIAPTSLVSNWVDEATKFTPSLRVLAYHGASRRQHSFDEYDIVISTYAIIRQDRAKFLDHHFYYIILDEAQWIKNSQSRTTLLIQQLSGAHRLCLTGTPLENHLGELWSLFHFLMPGLLGTKKQFNLFFKVPIEKEHSLEKNQLLQGRIKPFMLRRTKQQVLQELPHKTDILYEVDLTGNQRNLYEIIRVGMEKKVRDSIELQGFNKSRMVILEALLKLRQVCCDPRLLGLDETNGVQQSSAKLTILMQLIDDLVKEGRSVLVFSQFTSMLSLIEHELHQRTYPYLKLTGSTVHRKQVIDDFQSGMAPIFLLSLKAGGAGLTLTRADTVILYDPWWNPQVENQASGRAHRIGQLNKVFVYKLVAKGTVEEMMLKIQANKQSLFDQLMQPSSEYKPWDITIEDINYFFAPLAS